MVRLAMCGAVLVMLVGGCGASAPGVTVAAKSTGPLLSEAAAAAVSGALLAAVPLPEHTQREHEPSRAVAGKLGRPINIDEAKAVDRHEYWSSTERPEAMLSFLAKKGPIPKVQYSGYGGTDGKTEGWSETLNAPSMSPLAGPRQLFVSIVLDGSGRYAVRVDAVVAWHKRRSQSSLVSAAARWLEVTVITPAHRALNPEEPAHARATTRSLITTSPAAVRAVARAVNELPVAEPSGSEPSCPAMAYANTAGAPRFLLTFRGTASGGNLARVIGASGHVCERGGGATAKIATPEDPQGVQLTDHLTLVGPVKGEGLTEHIEVAFQHHLHLVPES